MGADGGVCWVALNDHTQYQRVKDLLRPFYFLTESGNADWQEAANRQFIASNGYFAPEYLVGSYGSFQDFSIYEDLRDILGSGDEICADPSLTFIELVDDLVTRPVMPFNGSEWQYLLEDRIIGRHLLRFYGADGKQASVLEAMVWDCVDTTYLLHGREKTIESLIPIHNMRVCDWADELCSLLDYDNIDHEETWT